MNTCIYWCVTLLVVFVYLYLRIMSTPPFNFCSRFRMMEQIPAVRNNRHVVLESFYCFWYNRNEQTEQRGNFFLVVLLYPLVPDFSCCSTLSSVNLLPYPVPLYAVLIQIFVYWKPFKLSLDSDSMQCHTIYQSTRYNDFVKLPFLPTSLRVRNGGKLFF